MCNLNELLEIKITLNTKVFQSENLSIDRVASQLGKNLISIFDAHV